jgi:hypothetical protein
MQNFHPLPWIGMLQEDAEVKINISDALFASITTAMSELSAE